MTTDQKSVARNLAILKVREVLDATAVGDASGIEHAIAALDNQELELALSLIDATSRALWNEACRQARKDR